MMTTAPRMAETVTIPARLLLHLYWAAECLTGLRHDEDDGPMLSEARGALAEQAPRTAQLLELLDGTHTTDEPAEDPPALADDIANTPPLGDRRGRPWRWS